MSHSCVSTSTFNILFCSIDPCSSSRTYELIYWITKSKVFFYTVISHSKPYNFAQLRFYILKYFSGFSQTLCLCLMRCLPSFCPAKVTSTQLEGFKEKIKHLFPNRTTSRRLKLRHTGLHLFFWAGKELVRKVNILVHNCHMCEDYFIMLRNKENFQEKTYIKRVSYMHSYVFGPALGIYYQNFYFKL